jgi:hypothetical protein
MLNLDLFFGRGGAEQTGKPNHNIINRDEFADPADHTLNQREFFQGIFLHYAARKSQ